MDTAGHIDGLRLTVNVRSGERESGTYESVAKPQARPASAFDAEIAGARESAARHPARQAARDKSSEHDDSTPTARRADPRQGATRGAEPASGSDRQPARAESRAAGSAGTAEARTAGTGNAGRAVDPDDVDGVASARETKIDSVAPHDEDATPERSQPQQIDSNTDRNTNSNVSAARPDDRSPAIDSTSHADASAGAPDVAESPGSGDTGQATDANRMAVVTSEHGVRQPNATAPDGLSVPDKRSPAIDSTAGANAPSGTSDVAGLSGSGDTGQAVDTHRPDDGTSGHQTIIGTTPARQDERSPAADAMAGQTGASPTDSEIEGDAFGVAKSVSGEPNAPDPEGDTASRSPKTTDQVAAVRTESSDAIDPEVSASTADAAKPASRVVVPDESASEVEQASPGVSMPTPPSSPVTGDRAAGGRTPGDAPMAPALADGTDKRRGTPAHDARQESSGSLPKPVPGSGSATPSVVERTPTASGTERPVGGTDASVPTRPDLRHVPSDGTSLMASNVTTGRTATNGVSSATTSTGLLPGVDADRVAASVFAARQVTNERVALHEALDAIATRVRSASNADTRLPSAPLDGLTSILSPAPLTGTLSAAVGVSESTGGGLPSGHAPTRLPLFTAQAAHAFVDNVRWMAGEGISNARLALHPAGLGAIDVQLTLEQDALHVTVQAGQATTREALEQMLPRLRDQLAASGFERVNVDISDREAASGGGHADRHGTDSALSEPADDARPTGTATTTEAGESIDSRQHRGLVDLTV